MRRIVYLSLVLLRLYFTTVPSYIHPDEHFQGPEIITGAIFGWPSYTTWEFTSERPIRSVFPLWLIYGPPLTLLRWISEGLGYDVFPLPVFYVLRILMFALSFVLEDWALHELLPVKSERATALMLVASSYVTWTFQMHNFSNSIETIIVLWCLVLMRRMKDNSEHTQFRLCIALAFLGVLGVFNRITFPAFLVPAAVQLVPHLAVKPWRAPAILLAGLLTTLVAVAMDTEYYTGNRLRLRDFFSTAVMTPWNNMAYNLDAANLAQHGLHPFWQHFVANLPQLIGPAIPLLFISSRRNTLFWSGITGIAILSCFRHQEPRFLLPAVPLLLASVDIPKRFTQPWVYAWVAFNTLAAIVFGFYHQAGIIPVQTWIVQQPEVSHVIWWKTYSPPRWLLGERNVHVNTTDLMGMSGPSMIRQLSESARCHGEGDVTLLVAPSSATFLDAYTSSTEEEPTLILEKLLQHRQHIGLDDLDFGDDGVWPTLKRVVGRRGLTVWRVSRNC
ncbi:hypothetical protein LTR36_009452 [Oleoguttula mirabilis]|uniref:Mannosyltransferase n=1 Tax=Oleoguttula mirabilis TaxID=1507867 RepID=A0AAV9JS92_9PEZI|nr:hypothetical protein LTR36_009452 [Oleoguttula mirabilis]